MGLKLLNLSALKLEVPEISVRSSSQVLLLSGPLGVFPTPVCIRHQERPGVEFIAGFRALPWWLPSIGTPFLFQLLLKCSPEPPSSSKDGCRFFFFCLNSRCTWDVFQRDISREEALQCLPDFGHEPVLQISF